MHCEGNRCGGKGIGAEGREEVEYDRKRCIVKGRGAVGREDVR